jgi:hypothetical protein
MKPIALSVLKLAGAAFLAALAVYTALDLAQPAEHPYLGRRVGITTPYGAGLPFR